MIRQAPIVCLAIVLSSGCAAPRPPGTPITAPVERMSFRGFSILPPQGDNWYITFREPGGVAFAKSLLDRSNRASPGHPFGAIATLVYPKEGIVEDLRAYAEYRNRSEDHWTTLQSRVTACQIAQHPEVECVRSESVSEARDNRLFP